MLKLYQDIAIKFVSNAQVVRGICFRGLRQDGDTE